MTGRIAEYEYSGGSDAERTGGRRNRCLSLRPVGGAGADTERGGAAGWELRSGGWDEDGTGGGRMAGAAAAGC